MLPVGADKEGLYIRPDSLENLLRLVFADAHQVAMTDISCFGKRFFDVGACGEDFVGKYPEYRRFPSDSIVMPSNVGTERRT